MSHWTDPYVGIEYEELDCWRLVERVYLEVYGIALLKCDVTMTDGPEAVIDAFARERAKWLKVDVPVEGDIVDIAVMSAPHVGIVIDGGLFLHATLSSFSCTERLASPKWRHRILNYYRHPSRR